jgi:hypothetical protein
MLDLTAGVVGRGVVGARFGHEDAQIRGSLRPAEWLGCGDGCWRGRRNVYMERNP